jgi:putative NADPH-quinone reductase
MLKGYFDRVWRPGVTFDLVDGKLVSKLFNIRRLISVNTYGADPIRAFLAGNPPGRIINRVFRVTIKPGATIKQLKHWSMDRSTDESRKKFLAKVRREMERF